MLAERGAQLVAHHRQEVGLVPVVLRQALVGGLQLQALFLEPGVGVHQLPRPLCKLRGPLGHLGLKTAVQAGEAAGHVVELQRELVHLRGGRHLGNLHIKGLGAHLVEGLPDGAYGPDDQGGHAEVYD